MRSDPKRSAVKWRTRGAFTCSYWGTGGSTTTSKLKPAFATTIQVKMLWLCDLQAGSRKCTLIFNCHPVQHRSVSLLPALLRVPSSGGLVSVQRKGVAVSSENIPGFEQLWKEGVLPNALTLPSQKDHVLKSFTSCKASNRANVST